MNYIDIIFLIVILYCAFMGLKTGLVRSIGGIIAIIIGFYGASLFYVKLSIWIQSVSSIFSPTVSNIFAFILLFILFDRLFMILVFILDKIVSVPIIGFLNKILGGILGFFAGALIVGILVLILSSFSNNSVSAFENSQVVPKANKAIELLKPFIPKTINTSFLDKIGLKKANEIIQDLPDTDSMSVDELIEYLSQKGEVSKDTINKLKETQFKDTANVNVSEIKSKFQEYLDKLK